MIRCLNAEIRTLVSISSALLVAWSVIGCDDDSYPPDQPQLLDMSLYSPNEYSEDQELSLVIGGYNGSTYFAWAPNYRLYQGALSEQQLSTLHAHTTPAAADSLASFAVESDRCTQFSEPEAYMIDIADTARSVSRTGMLCIVPEEVGEEAKEHIDSLVELFNELTGGLEPL